MMKKISALLLALALSCSPAMASGNSNYLGAKILGWATGTQMPTPPSSLYIALFNGDPTDTGTGGSEVTTTVRTAGRVAATFGTVNGKSMANNAVVNFGPAANNATFTYFAIYDSASAGNMLVSGPLTGGGTTVSSGTTVSFSAGSLNWNE